MTQLRWSIGMLSSCRRMTALCLCSPPAIKSALCRCWAAHHQNDGVAKERWWALGLKRAPCVLPLCLALVLSKECVAPALAESYVSPLSQAAGARLSFASRVDHAISLLERGRQAQSQGDFPQALLWYTQVIKEDGDLALAEYARVGRAISLYEIGDREEAFVEMEDVSVSLKGYPGESVLSTLGCPVLCIAHCMQAQLRERERERESLLYAEVHAALAAVLYVDKKSPLSAEQQFTMATLLDPHYSDLSYVKDTKHWPPSLVQSLAKLIDLQ